MSVRRKAVQKDDEAKEKLCSRSLIAKPDDDGTSPKLSQLRKQHAEGPSHRKDGAGGAGRSTEGPPGPKTTRGQRLTKNMFVRSGDADCDTATRDSASRQPSTPSSRRPVRTKAGGGDSFTLQCPRVSLHIIF